MKPIANMEEKTKEFRRMFLRGRLLRGLVVGLFLAFSLSLILVLQFLPSEVDLEIGEVSPTDIRSPRRITYVSEVMTEEERKAAEEVAPPVYDPADPEVLRRQLEKAQTVFAYVDSVRHDPYANREEKESLLSQIPGISLIGDAAAQTLEASEEEWAGVATESLFLLDQILRQDIPPEGLAEAKRQVPSRVSLSLTPGQAALVEAWVVDFIVPNSFLNPTLTEETQAAARDSVQPLAITIEEGEVILREGDVTTPLAWEKLGVLGLRQPSIKWPEILSRVLFASVMVALLISYLERLQPKFWEDSRKVLILVVLLVAGVLGAKILIPGSQLLHYLFPLATVSMLVTTLLGAEIAVASTVVLSLFLGFIGGGSLELTLYGLAGGIFSALGLYRLERVNGFLWAGLWCGLANVATLAIFKLLDPMDPVGFLSLIAAGLVNGGLSASLALGGFFVFSNFLGMVTPLQLLELARPTHPLLKELLLKAPGTYHHSLMVSNLAEQAAEAVGADPLLARVGGYYHDVGKTLRPYLFVENQEEGINIHEKLDPKLSAQMIIAHVQDGLDLARKYGLPQAIRDFIPQHHGTGQTAYFYHQVSDADVEEFTYPGPRPKSREAGILMLADGVEATIRAEHPASFEEAKRIVGQIVESRLREGQLDATELTLRDVEKIKETFLQVLEGMYGPRIRYPAEDEGTQNRASDPQKNPPPE